MTRNVVLVLSFLTLVAGYVDAVSFFSLGVFTANMTGTTVLLGGAIVGRFIPHVRGDIGILMPAVSLASFATGALIASLIVRNEQSRPPQRSRAVLATIAVMLAANAALQRWGGAEMIAWGVGLLSGLMGAQTVVAVRCGVPTISTTVVTGTLVRAIVDLVGAKSTVPEVRSEGRFNAAIVAYYFLGGLAGTAGLLLLGPNALWPASVVVAILVAMI